MWLAVSNVALCGHYNTNQRIHGDFALARHSQKETEDGI